MIPGLNGRPVGKSLGWITFLVAATEETPSARLSSKAVRSRILESLQQLAHLRLDLVTAGLPDKRFHLLAGAIVEEQGRQRAGPFGIDGIDKSRIVFGLLAMPGQPYAALDQEGVGGAILFGLVG